MVLNHFMRAVFVTIATLFMAYPAHAGLDALKPATLWERIQKEVAKKEISSNIPLVSADIIDGLSTSLQYRIQSEPSYVDGFYTRLDKYIMNFDLRPGDYIEALDTPVGMNIRKGAEIIFARQFKTQKDSLLALPYTPRNLPFTAQAALERLEPGDFVSIQGNLSFVVSLGKDFLKGDFSVGASTHAYMSGDFKAHIFRMADDKVRVKLIGTRGKGVGADIGAHVDENLDIVGIQFFDDAIERWIGLTPPNAHAGYGQNDIIMLDYVFDLKNAEAAEAYNSLMLYKVQLKDVKVANPAASMKDLTQELLTDLTDVEQIALNDSLKPTNERRIDRIFKGTSQGFNKDAGIKFGINFWKFQTGKAYGENKVLSYDKQNKEQYFLLDTLSRYKKTKILFGLFGEETLMTSNLLFTADSNWKPQRFVTLTASAELRIKDVSEGDLEEMQRIVKDTIGESQYKNIDWSKWEGNKSKKVNGYFKQEVFFNPEALNTIPSLSADAWAASFRKYVELKGRPRSRPFFGGNSPIDYLRPWIHAFTFDIRRVGNHLSIVVDPTKSIQDRFEAFESLQQIPIWKERGIGFLISFIPEYQRPELMRYEMILSAKDMSTIDYRYGSFAEEKLYRAMMYIQNIIHNRSFDLRLYTDGQGEFTTSAAPAP